MILTKIGLDDTGPIPNMSGKDKFCCTNIIRESVDPPRKSAFKILASSWNIISISRLNTNQASIIFRRLLRFALDDIASLAFNISFHFHFHFQNGLESKINLNRKRNISQFLVVKVIKNTQCQKQTKRGCQYVTRPKHIQEKQLALFFWRGLFFPF